MAVLKLHDDYFEHQYTFVAIHASLEDVRLAFFLNAQLQIKLKRKRTDLILSPTCSLPVFDWFDEVRETEWVLVKNRAIVQPSEDASGLFPSEASSGESRFLVPELPKVDYFLKADQYGAHPQAPLILSKIKDIRQVITAYEVDASLLKSKDNLILLSDAD